MVTGGGSQQFIGLVTSAQVEADSIHFQVVVGFDARHGNFSAVSSAKSAVIRCQSGNLESTEFQADHGLTAGVNTTLGQQVIVRSINLVGVEHVQRGIVLPNTQRTCTKIPFTPQDTGVDASTVFEAGGQFIRNFDIGTDTGVALKALLVIGGVSQVFVSNECGDTGRPVKVPICSCSGHCRTGHQCQGCNQYH